MLSKATTKKGLHGSFDLRCVAVAVVMFVTVMNNTCFGDGSATPQVIDWPQMRGFQSLVALLT